MIHYIKLPMKTDRSKETRPILNRVAIITGAAKGIGKGIAQGFARNGAYVVIADIDKKESVMIAKELEKLGTKVLVIPTDVGNDKENDKLVDEVLSEFGVIDILVNNAGINVEHWGILEPRDRGNDKAVFNTNLIGPYLLTQRVAREMVERQTKGNILFISSIHSRTTQLHPAYSSTKAALEMLVRDTALELVEHGIRVNGIAPGAVSIRGKVDPENPTVPMCHSGMPRDIANTALFLVSEKARYITGQTIVVDGGLSLTHVFWERYKKRKKQSG